MSERTKSAISLPDRLEVDRLCLLFESRRIHATCRAQLCVEILRTVSSQAVLELALFEMVRIELSSIGIDGLEESTRRFQYLFPSQSRIIDLAAHSVFPSKLKRGAQIGCYRVIDWIGSGSFGDIFSASDSSGQRVAIKVFRVYCDSEAESSQLLRHEVAMLQRVRHPCILPLLDFGCDVQNEASLEMFRPWLATPLMQNGTLRDEISKGPVSIERFKEVAVSLLSALSYIHALDLFHLDLKPANILLADDAKPVLADFGLSVQMEQQDRHRGEIAGSLPYMSPEQLQGEAHWLDGRADLWAFGVICYEMLTASKPFPSQSRKDLLEQFEHRSIRPISQLRADVPRLLEETILRCLRVQPSERPPSATALLSDLLPLFDTRKKSSADRTRKLFHYGWLTLVAAILLLWFSLTSPVQNIKAIDPTKLMWPVDDFVLGLRHAESPLLEDRLLQLFAGDSLELSVRADVECWLYVISFEMDRSLLLIPDIERQEPPIRIAAQSWTKLPVLHPQAAEQIEHLTIIASTTPLSANSISQLLLDLSHSSSFVQKRSLIRGLSRTHHRRVSTLMIPYSVSANDPSKSRLENL